MFESKVDSIKYPDTMQEYRMYCNDVIKAYSKFKIVNGKEEEKHDN